MTDQPSRTHDAQHERVLEQLMTGQLQEHDPAVAALRHCAACRERLQRLERVATLLDAAGNERRAILAEAVERHDATPPQPTAGRWRRRWPILVSAAAVLIAAAVYLPMRGCGADRPNDSMLLGSGGFDVKQCSPNGAVKEFGEFRWPTEKLDLDETYVIQIFEVDASGAASADPIVESEEIPVVAGAQFQTWTPSGTKLARVRACTRIQWQVAVRDSTTKLDPRPFVRSHRS